MTNQTAPVLNLKNKLTMSDGKGSQVTWTPTSWKFRGQPDVCAALQHKLQCQLQNKKPSLLSV